MDIITKKLGLQPYLSCWEAMRLYTENRDADSEDQLWLVEHPPIFTQGIGGKAEHILAPGDIPVVQIDRGGQVTYHAPGQAVMYLLLDIKRAGIGIRALVSAIENSVIELLKNYGITGTARADAPGVYINGDKIASLGLKIRRGCTYHGASLNVNLDLAPFSRINPCGLVGIRMVRLKDFGVCCNTETIAEQWSHEFSRQWHILLKENSGK